MMIAKANSSPVRFLLGVIGLVVVAITCGQAQEDHWRDNDTLIFGGADRDTMIHWLGPGKFEFLGPAGVGPYFIGKNATTPAAPASGQVGYFKAGNGYCAIDSSGVERCTGGVVTSGIEDDILSYGATCNGSSDDTPALQAWINARTATGGNLLVRNNCYFHTSPVFPITNASPFTLVLNGNLKVGGATFVLPGQVNMICRTGGGNPASFQSGPVCTVFGDANIDPAVQAIQGGTLIQNISIKAGANSSAFLAGGTTGQYPSLHSKAILRLDNVSLTTTSGASTYPLIVDRWLWMWTNHLRLSSFGAVSNWSMHITNTAVTEEQVGILQFDDTILSGHGILIDSVSGVNNFGNIRFKNVWRETGQGPLIKFDLTNLGFMEDVELSHLEEADAISITPCSLQIVHPGTTGHAFGIHITDSPNDDMELCGDTQYAQVYHDGVGDGRGRELNFTGTRMWNYTARSARWDADSIAMDTERRYLPLGAVVMNQAQDPANWLNGAWTTTTGPDGGSTTAGKNSTAGATSIWSFGSNKLGSWAVGDWVCAGIWMKTDVSGTSFPSGTLFDFGLFNDTPSSGSPAVDGDWQNGAHFSSDRVGGAFYHDQWQQRVGCGKVIALNAGITTYGANLQIYGSATNVVDYAKPWLIRIPSASITEGDVVRIRRNGLKAVAQDSIAGAINYFKGEQICVGGACRTQTTSRTSPVAFASLASCAAGLEGTTAAVNDSSTVTWGATITGGSTNHVLAYCDGTNWTVAGK